MKKFFLLIIILIALNISNIFPCEIKVSSDKNEYNIGDLVVFTITLNQDHARCLHEGEEPKITQTGLELIGKTEFTKIDNDTWQIKYKAKVADKNASLTAIREC